MKKKKTKKCSAFCWISFGGKIVIVVRCAISVATTAAANSTHYTTLSTFVISTFPIDDTKHWLLLARACALVALHKILYDAIFKKCDIYRFHFLWWFLFDSSEILKTSIFCLSPFSLSSSINFMIELEEREREKKAAYQEIHCVFSSFIWNCGIENLIHKLIIILIRFLFSVC